jgi:hypothetical protein
VDKVSVLSLAPRKHQLLSERGGARRPADRPRPVLDVLDLVVDGTSLLDIVRAQLPRYTLRSPLWLGTAMVEFHAAALLGLGPSDVHESDPRDHVALLMCPHCGIGGCGVLSARLVRNGAVVHWTDIARQLSVQHGIGPFTFDAGQYDAVLRPLLAAPRPGT